LPQIPIAAGAAGSPGFTLGGTLSTVAGGAGEGLFCATRTGMGRGVSAAAGLGGTDSGDAKTVGTGPDEGARCVVWRGVGLGAATAALGGAGLEVATTVGAGPDDGARRLVFAGVDLGPVAVTVAVTGLGDAATVAAGADEGARCGVDAVALGAVAGFTAPAGGMAVITTGARAVLGGVAGVAPATALGLYPQTCLRLRDTLGTQVTLPSMPARI